MQNLRLKNQLHKNRMEDTWLNRSSCKKIFFKDLEVSLGYKLKMIQ